MGSVSVSNSNPWAPNAVLKDCSQGICSAYCPQWCYIIYSPPPPSVILGGGDDHPSAFQFSPLIVAVIGILASTFILVTYYTVISRFCRNRGGGGGRIGDPSSTSQIDPESGQVSSSSSSGLDESQIRSIRVCKYVKGGGLVIEGSDCSVCLSEFQENETLRLLPKCNHAFHLPCIDTWLKSHSSCPLCRNPIINSNERDHAAVATEAPGRINMNSLEYQQTSDVVVFVEPSRQDVVVDFGAQVVQEKCLIEVNTSQRRVSVVVVADIVNQIEEDDDA